jgi:hydrogenase-1 operon protein HyaF
MVTAKTGRAGTRRCGGTAMSGLDNIAVNVESFTGNVQPLLHEIRHALQRVAEGEAGTVIDLRSLPLAPGEEEQIETELGQGEIYAELYAEGTTTIRESSYPGVWFVTHSNAAQEIVSKFIEVTLCPDLLKSQQDDVETGLERLDEHLSDSVETDADQYSANER